MTFPVWATAATTAPRESDLMLVPERRGRAGIPRRLAAAPGRNVPATIPPTHFGATRLRRVVIRGGPVGIGRSRSRSARAGGAADSALRLGRSDRSGGV